MKVKLWGFLFLGMAYFVADAHAVVVMSPWSVTINGGPYNGTVGSGSFSYDNSALIVGNETLSPGLGDLQITFTILGQTFHETDDVDSPAYPRLDFNAFTPTFMNYLLSESLGNSPIAINEPGVDSIFLIGPLTPVAAGGFQSAGEIIVVPEPVSGVPFVLALAAFFPRRARRNRR
jgi:hypothetical protein